VAWAAEAIVSADSQPCVACHARGNPGEPGLVTHWEGSAHGAVGVGCAECHGVPAAGKPELTNPRYVVKTTWDKGTGLKTVELVTDGGAPVERPDLWNHGGREIVAAVSPRTCAQCHRGECAEFHTSRHSSAAQFIGSIDNFLGRFAEGPAAANSGCQQCHGSVLQVVPPRDAQHGPTYTADTWPNTGVGRVNADGSWGACTACHSRHAFSSALARRPDSCGKCHLGPDHPQMEIYQESKHGIAFKANETSLNLDAPAGEWVLGKTYTQAPSCTTCHMGATAARPGVAGLALTHDVGARISWTLRPAVSFQPKGIVAADGTVVLKPPTQRRAEMKQVCLMCHAPNWVEGFYVQYDQAVNLYNEKYAKPLVAIYDFLQKEKLIDAVPMNEEMDYVYFELWHHEGRCARHGASMMGPDYVQWHGFYPLSRNFYTRFLPLARELGRKGRKAKQVEQAIAQALRGADGKDWDRYHRWTQGLTENEKKAMLEWESEAYGQKGGQSGLRGAGATRPGG
jgi:hypothetical protein